MDRATTNKRGLNKDKSDGSFKFIISLIIFTLTVLSRIYVYMQENFVELELFYVISMLTFTLGITFVFMCCSLFMKAVVLEVKNDRHVKYLESYATELYLAGFFIIFTGFLLVLASCIVCFILPLILDIVTSLPGTPNAIHWRISLSLVMISNIITSFLVFSFIAKPFKEELAPIINNFQQKKVILPTILSVIFILLFTFYMSDSDSILKMNDVYNKQNEQIPIELTMTGALLNDDDVVINLSKLDSNNDLIIIDSIKVKSDPNLEKIHSSTYLTCENIDFGKYKVFVNCTNLTKGYYKFSVSLGEPSLFVPDVEVATNIFYLV
ncbi:hypothetical protein [Methanosarcina mazei]|uniref:hypothetical protein n=1 Tax=Methanosarcina mazei TaxID=2209 RepID=UPI000AFDC89F|nr:hypothetical protein [Methanosarcina mazei]